MAGIFDDVMDGIAAKEKQGEQTQPAAKPATAPKEGEKPMHGYSDDFKEKYGEHKPA